METGKFLLLACYISISILMTGLADRQPTNLSLWKISNDCISAMGRQIHLVVGSRVSYSFHG